MRKTPHALLRPSTFLFALLPTSLLFLTLILCAAPAAADLSYSSYLHEATNDNVFFNSTSLDHPKLNGNANAKVFVVERRTGSLVTSPHGVWYDGASWLIFNQDLSAMTAGRRFHVLIVEESPEVLTHSATLSNIFGAATEIDHPDLNDNPDAIFLITQTWEPFDVYNNANTGVLYIQGRWRIFNEDLISDMPEGASFNVLILNDEPSAFLATANSAFSCSGLPSLPAGDLSIFLTHRWADGTSLNDHPFAIDHTVFSGPNPQAICLLDGEVMPSNTQFVVFPAAIFTDGFESESVNAWSASVNPI